MKRRKRVLILAACVLAGVRPGIFAAPSHDDAFSKQGLLKANVADLKDTQLVAHPDMPLAPNQNMLWCATLQLAWNEAIGLVGEPLHFTSPSPVADLLNQRDFTRDDLDPSCYVAIADFERHHVEAEIRAALEKKFHGAASPELIPSVPKNPGPDDFVAYAYLFKNLAFVQPFADKGALLFGDRRVESFGFDSQDRLRAGTVGQASFCDYQSPSNFIVELKTKSPGDQLILAKVPPGATLQATMNGVLDRLSHHALQPAGMGDTLTVPKLNFDLRRDFQELEGLVLQPSPNAKIKNKLVIAKVEQLVRFQLNEKGAILKSEATMTMRATMVMAGHQLIFDGPFLILLKQTQALQPYFALWVGNASLLIPAASPSAGSG